MRYADAPSVQQEVFVAAAPETLWPLVTDLDLIATLSSELQQVTWLDGAAQPAVGGRFRGRNTHPMVGEWETVSQVTECDPPRAFAWLVEDPENPTAVWRFSLHATDGGTVLRQWAQLGPGPSNLTPLIEQRPELEERIVRRRLDDFRAAIEQNLTELKRFAERTEGTLAAD